MLTNGVIRGGPDNEVVYNGRLRGTARVDVMVGTTGIDILDVPEETIGSAAAAERYPEGWRRTRHDPRRCWQGQACRWSRI